MCLILSPIGAVALVGAIQTLIQLDLGIQTGLPLVLGGAATYMGLSGLTMLPCQRHFQWRLLVFGLAWVLADLINYVFCIAGNDSFDWREFRYNGDRDVPRRPWLWPYVLLALLHKAIVLQKLAACSKTPLCV